MAHLNLRRTSTRGAFRPLGAVEIYGLGLRTKFQSYANSKVRWVILDELRKVDPMPQWARLRMRETERARNELAQTLGRVPTEPEVARRLGVEVGEHRAAGPVCAGTGGGLWRPGPIEYERELGRRAVRPTRCRPRRRRKIGRGWLEP
jgi:hypothetical protein